MCTGDEVVLAACELESAQGWKVIESVEYEELDFCWEGFEGGMGIAELKV